MFNFCNNNNSNISNNAQFQFAQKHALHFHKYKVIYTFIPKNGCTTLRASVAATNGLMEKESLTEKNINWIHNNTYTFSANINELICSSYKFTVLRCPYDRMVSLFLDKFVDKTPVAWNFYRQSNNHQDLNYLTFAQFIDYLHEHPNIINGDIHWKTQSSFLVYKHYDDYFHFDNFKNIESSLLNKFPIQFIDARNVTRHGRDQSKQINDGFYFDSTCNELLALKLKGLTPSKDLMLNDDLRTKIRSMYQNDFNLLERTNFKTSN